MSRILIILGLLCFITQIEGPLPAITDGRQSSNARCRESLLPWYYFRGCRFWHWEQRWRYDSERGQCVFDGWTYVCGLMQFNRFSSRKECRRTCECSLPAYTGKCRGYFIRYYYDPQTDSCRHFVYGGCNSNANNFETAKDCVNACGTSQTRIVSQR